MWRFIFAIFCVLANNNIARADDPYRYFTWNITYGDIYPLGIRQQVRIRTFTLIVINKKNVTLLKGYFLKTHYLITLYIFAGDSDKWAISGT